MSVQDRLKEMDRKEQERNSAVFQMIGRTEYRVQRALSLLMQSKVSADARKQAIDMLLLVTEDISEIVANR